MLKAGPKNLITQSGLSVSYQPSFCITRNCGIIVTCAGIIMVPSKAAKQIPRPGHRRRAKA